MKPKNAGCITTEAEANRPKYPQPEYAIRYNYNGWHVAKFCPIQDKFTYRWPYAVSIAGTDLKMYEGPNEKQAPLVGIVGIQVGFGFRERMKQLKDAGWHNSGPDLEKRCFFFSMKQAGGQGNKPIQIALRFDASIAIWAGKPEDNTITDQLINMVTMLNS